MSRTKKRLSDCLEDAVGRRGDRIGSGVAAKCSPTAIERVARRPIVDETAQRAKTRGASENSETTQQHDRDRHTA
jgi:hypothetical protein